VHHKWDKSLAPAIEIESGDTVHFETVEVTNNQVTPECDVKGALFSAGDCHARKATVRLRHRHRVSDAVQPPLQRARRPHTATVAL
jgi:hypothetical protein